jgi:thymidylate synthase (FAD)
MNAELLQVMGDDLMVVNAARVSMDKHHESFDESDEKLIRYLATHDHWTPFSHPQIQMRIKAPIFVARQWYRSVVGVARNEVSRRYVDSDPEFFTPEVWRARPDGSIKQGSGGPIPETRHAWVQATYSDALRSAEWFYQALLNEGIAPEQARMVLPQSMMTTWIETGSLAYWARVCNLRIDAHAQAEIQDLAKKVSDQIAPHFSVSWSALTGQEPPQKNCKSCKFSSNPPLVYPCDVCSLAAANEGTTGLSLQWTPKR